MVRSRDEIIAILRSTMPDRGRRFGARALPYFFDPTYTRAPRPRPPDAIRPEALRVVLGS